MKIDQTSGQNKGIGTFFRNLFGSQKERKDYFQDSGSYWKNRYETGGTSGNGSYNQLAEFKADVLNRFVSENDVASVIEFGCGDGNQLALARYPNYIGFDISPESIAMCSERFAGDETTAFKLLEAYNGETAELTLSLDVIFHLVEDDVFADHMAKLFDSSERFVIIYSSNTDENPADIVPHVRHRNFSRWVENNRPGWKLVAHIPNKYPFTGNTRTSSFADFYIYAKDQ